MEKTIKVTLSYPIGTITWSYKTNIDCKIDYDNLHKCAMILQTQFDEDKIYKRYRPQDVYDAWDIANEINEQMAEMIVDAMVKDPCIVDVFSSHYYETILHAFDAFRAERNQKLIRNILYHSMFLDNTDADVANNARNEVVASIQEFQKITKVFDYITVAKG